MGRSSAGSGSSANDPVLWSANLGLGARVLAAMIHVVIQEGGKVLGELRIECLTPFSTHGVDDYSIEFAADNGGGWVDLRRRVLYGFKATKYNALALVSEALNLLELNEMEYDVAPDTGPGRMARQKRGARPALPREAQNPERHH